MQLSCQSQLAPLCWCSVEHSSAVQDTAAAAGCHTFVLLRQSCVALVPLSRLCSASPTISPLLLQHACTAVLLQVWQPFDPTCPMHPNPVTTGGVLRGAFCMTAQQNAAHQMTALTSVVNNRSDNRSEQGLRSARAAAPAAGGNLFCASIRDGTHHVCVCVHKTVSTHPLLTCEPSGLPPPLQPAFTGRQINNIMPSQSTARQDRLVCKPNRRRPISCCIRPCVCAVCVCVRLQHHAWLMPSARLQAQGIALLPSRLSGCCLHSRCVGAALGVELSCPLDAACSVTHAGVALVVDGRFTVRALEGTVAVQLPATQAPKPVCHSIGRCWLRLLHTGRGLRPRQHDVGGARRYGHLLVVFVGTQAAIRLPSPSLQ